MADDVLVDNGEEADYTVSTDEGAGGHVQRVKLAYSADGAETHVDADADGLLVNLGANNDVSVSGTVAVTQSGTWDEVGINDSGNSITVDDGAGSLTVDGTVTANLAAGTNNIGDVDVLTLPALPAGNNNIGDVDISSIAAGDNNIGNVDIVTLPALPAGTNAIGKLAANSGVDIGDVDVTSVSGNVTVVQGTATNLKVDASGVAVPITDNSGSLTVDAPVGTPVYVRLSDGSSAIATLPVKQIRSSTSALTTVADNAASTSILAANSARLKAVITNDSSARLYLRFEAAAASTANYMVSLAQHETWEEFNYTGEIRGIWASDPNDGAARVTEFS